MSEINVDHQSTTGNIWASEVARGHFKTSLKIKNMLFSEKSDFQLVQVVDAVDLGKVLINDGVFMLSERDEFIYHDMITHLPMFEHGAVEKVLIIGGGDGGTAREVLRHPSVKKCVMVEIDEAVIRACRQHIPQTARCLDGSDARLELIVGDGVAYMQNATDTFDLIIVDSTDPIGPAKPLFGVSFYQDVRRRLRDNGVVVAQGESPFVFPDTQKALYDVIKEVFKGVQAYNYSNWIYPSGLFSFMIAQKDGGLMGAPANLRERITQSGLSFDYYNEDIHRAAFALPNFQRKKLGLA